MFLRHLALLPLSQIRQGNGIQQRNRLVLVRVECVPRETVQSVQANQPSRQGRVFLKKVFQLQLSVLLDIFLHIVGHENMLNPENSVKAENRTRIGRIRRICADFFMSFLSYATRSTLQA